MSPKGSSGAQARARRLGARVAALAVVATLAARALAEPTPARSRPRARGESARAADAGAPRGDAGVSAPRSERDREPDAPRGDAGASGKSLRFGELEIEGRLKSPQIVYFLRRVRAEFAAGDLGHRSFFPELEETRGEPVF